MLKTEAVSQYISQRSIKPFFLDEQSKYRTFGKKYKKAMEQSIWQEIGQLYQKFQELGISEAVDYEKYYLYSLSPFYGHWSSTLTEAEAQMLFDEGLTAKGKPLVTIWWTRT